MTQPATFATRQHFRLDFFIPAADWEGSFDRLEVWRARTLEAGPYENLHDVTWSPARLPVGFVGLAVAPGPSVILVEKTLTFLVNETIPVEVTFTGVDPLTFEQAATQITAQSLGLLSSFASSATLVVDTVQAGVLATLRCTGGDAAPILGLPTTEPGSLALGRDARIVLVHGQEQYGFIDPDGSSKYFYKVRYTNSITGLVSDFTSPFTGRGGAGLSTTSLVRGYVDLVNQSGDPLVNAEVLIGSAFGGLQLEGRTVSGGAQRLLTDASGHAEVFLARGLEVVVSIAGTALARTVRIPTDLAVQAINLLAPESGDDDLFAVQIPNLSYAVRRTM